MENEARQKGEISESPQSDEAVVVLADTSKKGAFTEEVTKLFRRNKNTKQSQQSPSVLRTLLWKNFILKKKRWKMSLGEILVPLFFILLLTALKSLTNLQVIDEGWSTDEATFCPYTGEEAVSAIAPVSCELPFNSFYRTVSTFQEIVSFIRRPTRKMFLTHSGGENEIQAMEDFIVWGETTGMAETGPIEGFRDMTRVRGSGSVDELLEYVRSTEYSRGFDTENPQVILAVSFNTIDFATADFDYTLRLNSSFDNNDIRTTQSENPAVEPLERGIRFGSGDENTRYLQEGFVSAQQFVDSFLIHRTNELHNFTDRANFTSEEDFRKARELFEPAGLNVVPFPVSEYSQDVFFVIIQDLLPLIFVITFISPVSQIVAVIVLEKEVRAREMLHLMGVPDYMIIVSWYVTYTVYFLLLGTIIAIFGSSVFPETTAASNGFSLVIVLVFYLFGMATASFSFLISTFFRKAFNGVVAGLMLFIMLFFTYYSFDASAQNDPDNFPTWCLLIPQVAFAFCMKILAALEASAIGLTWELLSFEIDGFSVSSGVLFLIIDFFYLTALGFYFNAVIPGEFGTPLPFYFPFQSSFYEKVYKDYQERKELRRENFDPTALRNIEGEDLHFSDPVIGEAFQELNETMKKQIHNQVGIQIRGLKKVFGTPDGPKTAVDDLSIDVFEGQILVLLGHNGAGKSTTLQMLSGSLTASGGDALVYGKRMTTEMTAIRKSLGFCPQHDVLYPQMSVYEHLKFYGGLKGLKGKKLEDAIQSSISQVGLTEKINVNSKSLSGGMKRKLSLGISLIGGSKVVFVDEPTSGVDPWSRRSMWEVLQNCREGRVIILTTHFMDEADILGDRIAIMAEGKLQCVGSSLYLKQLYGAGYQLTCVKKDKDNTDTAKFVTEDTVLRFIPGSKVVSDIGTELGFYLPLKETKLFAKLFHQLDDAIEQNESDILSYGVSVTTMEEVFLKAGQSADLLEGAKEIVKQNSMRSFKSQNSGKEQNMVSIVEDNEKRAKKTVLQEFTIGAIFLRQFFAIFAKRINYSKRDSYSFVCNTLVPVSIFTVGLLVLKFTPLLEDQSPLELTAMSWNPSFDTDLRARAFFAEYDESNNLLPFSEGRINRQENFDEFSLVDPEIDGGVVDGVRQVFDRRYVDGRTLDCTTTFRCPTSFPTLLGDTVLDFGPEILENQATDDREGASQFIASFAQVRQATVRDGRCFNTQIGINADTVAVELSYDSQSCRRTNSDCLYVQGTVLGIEQCLPFGCVSNLDVDDLLGFVGDTSGTVDRSDVEEIQNALVEANAAFYSCTGSFCNSGPSDLLAGNLCVGSPPGSGLPTSNPDCVADGLTQMAVSFELEEDGDLDIDFEDLFNASYCSEREFEPPTQTNPNERVCLDSDISDVIDIIEPLLDLLDSNITIRSSYNSATSSCVDESVLAEDEVCTFSVLNITGNAICIPACLSDELLDEILTDLVGAALAPTIDEILFGENVAIAECVEESTVCNTTLDLLAASDLINILLEANLTDILLSGELTDLIAGADIELPFDTSTVATVATAQRQLQTTDSTCPDDADLCTISNLGGTCINATCPEELSEAVNSILGDILGSLVGDLSTNLDSASCSDPTAISLLNCSTTIPSDDVANIDFLNDPALLLELLGVEVTDEQTEAVGDALAVLILGLTNGEDLDTLLTVLLETLTAAAIPGLEGLTTEDIVGLIDQLTAVIDIVTLLQENPELIPVLVAAVLNGLASFPVTCDSTASNCLLTELTNGVLDSSVVCFPAGCAEDTLVGNTSVPVIEDLADTLDSEMGLFLCNSSSCNFGCYAPSNCAAPQLTPVDLVFNESEDELVFLENDEVCFVEPTLRYGYTLLINTTAQHAVPIGVRQMHEALLRTSLTNSTSQVIGRIRTTNHPLPETSQTQQILQAIVAFTTAIFALLAFAFIPGPMISYAVMEKEEDVQIKHLQFVSGASIEAYWVGSYAFDLLTYLVPFSLAMLLIQLFEVTSFTENGAFEVVAVVFFGYGVAIIPFSYLVSHLFSKHTTALIGIIVINCITGLTLMIASFAMDQIPQTEDINPKLKYIYRFFPGFCLGDSLLQIATTSLFLGILGEGEGVPTLYDRDVTGMNLFYLYLEGFVFIIMVILVEYAKTHAGLIEESKEKISKTIKEITQTWNQYRGNEGAMILDGENKKELDVINPEGIDEDVLAEEQYIASGVDSDSHVVRMVNLRKVYKGGKVAVKGVSLGIPEGQCFGYLGINGAGKTSTLKCLTGDVAPSSGSGSIKSYDIVHNQTNVRKHVGYCSQFSSILGLLTVREHLEMFCRIKFHTLVSSSPNSNLMTPGEIIEENVQKLMSRLSLRPFENKLSKSLSGGNKRKLSVAIAMVGSPSVMLLDEPSTGMDVASRRFMWDVIENMTAGRYDGKKTSVILTTHSMEECEALCSRVGIMVGGRLRCLGSIQHLKNRFGYGFTIEARLGFVLKQEVHDTLAKVGYQPGDMIKINSLKEFCNNLGDDSIFETLAKNKRGSGWAILQKLEKTRQVVAADFTEWFLQQGKVEGLINFMQDRFAVEIVEGHDYHLVLKVTSDEARLGQIFEILEGNKQNLHVAEYSVSQTTLEQIFNGFAAQQEEETSAARGVGKDESDFDKLDDDQKEVRQILLDELDSE